MSGWSKTEQKNKIKITRYDIIYHTCASHTLWHEFIKTIYVICNIFNWNPSFDKNVKKKELNIKRNNNYNDKANIHEKPNH